MLNTIRQAAYNQVVLVRQGNVELNSSTSKTHLIVIMSVSGSDP
jgi:hypothetical protein